RRVAVDALAFASLDLGQLALVPKINAGIVHQFSDAGDALVSDHQPQVVGGQARSRGLEGSGRHARRQHDEKVQRQVFARLQHIGDAAQAEHVGVFVRVNDDRAGPVGDDSSCELQRDEHRALYVEMRIDQAGREIRTLQINDASAFVITNADYPSVIDRHVSPVYLPAEDID